MNIRSKQIKIAVLALLPLFPLIPLWKKAQERKEQALARALSDEVQRRQPRLEEVKRLLAEGANVKMRVDGCDILSHAALRNTDLLALLIQKGAHINGRSYDCAEPPALWNAAQAMRVDTVRLLLKHGADPNITTLDGFVA